MTTSVGTHDSIMDRLRSETAELHVATERHPFQQALAKGELPLGTFVEFLMQLYRIHWKLETALIQNRDHAAIAAVVLGHEYKLPFLMADLGHLNASLGEVTLTPGAAGLIEQIEARSTGNPAHLLGYLYVLEGSTNGAKYTAKALAQAYGLDSNRGLSYFDPYGDRQRPYWQAFKERMNGTALSAIDQDGIVRSAVAMFQAIQQIADQLPIGRG